jgi:tRNA(Ile)-lysidine synthase
MPAMTKLEQSILKSIRELPMVAASDRLGVAVSGGADSVALLLLLQKLSPKLGITLAVVHFDHSLRGAESDADAEFVRELAQQRGLEFFSAREDIASAAKKHRWNLEDAARRLRYAFFQRLVDQGLLTHIAVAHTADDQAETVLARILRGTGPSGLAGIHPVAGSIVRPLLEIRRRTLREFLQAAGQNWREDKTNSDLSRQRASIRHKLLPLLESDFSKDSVVRLADLARLAREEAAFWDALVESRFCAISKRLPTGEISVDIANLLVPIEQPEARVEPSSSASAPLVVLTERLIRRLYREVRGHSRDLDLRHVQQVIHLATKSSSGRHVELPGKIQVKHTFGELIFSSESASTGRRRLKETVGKQTAYQYLVVLSSSETTTISVPELKSRFRLKVIDWPSLERDTKRVQTALDADLLEHPLYLRTWRHGDAYRPFGHRRPKKLKEMFLKARVPLQERYTWPIMESKGRIVWVRNMPPAHEFCVKECSRTGVVIEEERLTGGLDEAQIGTPGECI